ncbi:MAG: PH domain-containing protein, partial [Treponema sp.]|nr:PH domain-containing protein [Treponema sp.]
LIFTNKRIIAIDVQGITGKRKSYSTLPYTTIQFFEVQTQGFAEIFPDSELFIQYANGFTAQFEFKGNVDIRKIGKMISNFVLN